MTDPDDQAGHDGWTSDDPRVQAGLDHLQRAAREMIAATRALLDVAEELVEDPHAAAGVVDLISGLAGRKGRGPAAHRDDEPDDGEPPVQRIPVS